MITPAQYIGNQCDAGRPGPRIWSGAGPDPGAGIQALSRRVTPAKAGAGTGKIPDTGLRRCDEWRRASAGFTLLEVLVALAIMGIAITLLIQLFSANLRSLAVSGDAVAAAAKANGRLREIMVEATLAETAWSETREIGYPMDISIKEILQERTGNLPVKLMEIDLTVHWQAGRKGKKLLFKTVKMIDKAAFGVGPHG